MNEPFVNTQIQQLCALPRVDNCSTLSKELRYRHTLRKKNATFLNERHLRFFLLGSFNFDKNHHLGNNSKILLVYKQQNDHD